MRRLAGLVLAVAAAASLAQAAPPGGGAQPRPGDDFYGYANGEWLRATALPPGRASWDTGGELRARAAERVQALIADAVGRPEAGPAATRSLRRKIADYYQSRLDRAAIEARGTAPLAPGLAAIAAIGDRRALSAYLGRTLAPDDGSNTRTEGLLGIYVHQGFHDPDRYRAHIVQGGLGLPDRDDYLAPDRAERREAYRAHVAAMLRLAGFAEAEARAGRVLALETAIAATHASRADTDDVFKTDNPWRRADFPAKAPGLDWDAYFAAAGLPQDTEFVVWQPAAVTGAAALVAAQPLDAWKDDLAFHLVEHFAAVLPAAFGAEDAAFAGRLSGRAPSPPDPAAEATAAVTQALGEAIGRLYVARDFPPAAKAAALAMVGNLEAACRARLANLAWMSPATRAKALAKLAALKVEVGYPDRWTDYSGLAVVRGDAFGNLARAEAFAWRRERAKLGRPVDPGEWTILPQLVGGVILFSPNTEQFSAALLQPPWFDPSGDSAANYGSAGAGMAHEITHSFDELGRLYDDRGRLGDWWTADDLARYRAATAPLAAQFAAYCPRPGLCVNGQQVLGENAADLAGLAIAYDAWKLSLHGRPAPVRDGLTGDQRFFLAFARRWRRLQTEAALGQQIAADTHAPGEYRADTVRNLEAWTRAFGVTPRDRLYLAPDARARIW